MIDGVVAKGTPRGREKPFACLPVWFTFNLTEFVTDYFFNVRSGDDSYSVSQDYHQDTGVNAWINGEEYPSGVFTSGTLTITKTDNLFTYKLNGTLVNGQTLSFHISVPASEWEYLEW